MSFLEDGEKEQDAVSRVISLSGKARVLMYRRCHPLEQSFPPKATVQQSRAVEGSSGDMSATGSLGCRVSQTLTEPEVEEELVEGAAGNQSWAMTFVSPSRPPVTISGAPLWPKPPVRAHGAN